MITSHFQLAIRPRRRAPPPKSHLGFDDWSTVAAASSEGLTELRLERRAPYQADTYPGAVIQLSGLSTVYLAVPTGFAEQVLPVLIGAAAALLGSVAVQLWLVPHVDRQKRHDEQWEADVLALGEALVTEQDSLLDKFRDSAYLLAEAHSAEEQEDPQTTAERIRNAESELDVAQRDLERFGVRIQLLAGRITAIAIASQYGQRLADAAQSHETALHYVVTWAEEPWQPDLEEDRLNHLVDLEIALAGASYDLVNELQPLYARRPRGGIRTPTGWL